MSGKNATDFRVKIATGLKAVSSEQWDACANPLPARRAANGSLPTHDTSESFNPFASHAFLSALEESGCVSGRTGWAPAHLLVEDGDTRLVGAAPCYLKSHSLGEYVFDHAWADAYARAGGHYYPKLQVSVPFTPVTGPRLLLAPGASATRARAALVAGLRALRADTDASSIHLTFLPEEDSARLASDGFLLRTGQQFHWFNE
ncbi:MAG TPA: peptidogalycan biosysnthesis protein, partial [Beijerinckiaceae bacterium]|nr:peptidogalycan biosysnthesis protein [Beijerinckiaceae bacterium]